MNRHICIHGHFYQPPRENPWLEIIETQESAYPYHDWNERINAECYEPNAVTRILGEKGKITGIENNYEKISFNFGPTLMSWIEESSPQVYEALLDADRLSAKRFGGHGNAIAQVYNHMIMPLADRHDKITQVIWGISDFKKRFKRQPEGMWLPETAVDMDTLRILVEHGIKFTILAPRQAKRVRPLGRSNWDEVPDGSIDPTMPYLVKIPSGGEIGIFFYDGGISHNIAFGDLLSKGENLANNILAAASNKKEVPHLIHVATDGETFGHHHKFGEMALAYCLNHIESGNHAKLTNYGEFLEKHPPTHEVELFENSSWSCMHGIERWRNNCGCNSGTNPGWTQAWRKPLRKAMDWLRDTLIPLYENEAPKYFIRPRDARNSYIRVILDRSRNNVEKFFRIHTERELSHEEKVTALKLLEMQRNAMLMYTSCGWFFDEVSGVENVQIMQYASKAMQYAAEIKEGLSLESEYLMYLKETPSNKFENAARVYEKYVKPAECDLLRVGAHYCISSIFENYAEETTICCYSTKSDSYEQLEAGKLKFAVGKTHIISDVTWEEISISFAVLHFGDQNISAGVRNFISPEDLSKLKGELKDAFERGDIPEIVRLMDNHFNGNIYSLWHLFKDEQKKVLDQILQLTYEGVETAYRQMYENNFTIMNFYDSLQHKIPRPFLAAAEYIINTDLKRIFEEETLDKAKLNRLIDEVNRWAVRLDTTTIGFSVNSWVNAIMENLSNDPKQIQLYEQIIDVMEIIKPLSLSLNLWKAQNNYFLININVFDSIKSDADRGDSNARNWIDSFIKLGSYLHVRI
jgi:alpha-amylase/alpha-mannosidase (GH57 family)